MQCLTRQRGQDRNQTNEEQPEQSCYPMGYKSTPPTLGDHPLPQFPFEWEPERDDKGQIKGLSENNPFSERNFNNRIKSSEKIHETLLEWSERLIETNPEKSKRINRLSFRVRDCHTFSAGIAADGKIATSATGGGFFRAVQRCNSRFCPRCARRTGRKSLERIFKRLHIDPETDTTPLRFLTLTMPGQPGVALHERVKRIRAALKRLYRSPIWKDRISGSIGKLEVTKKAKNWHVHAHFLIKGDYLPNKELRSAWAKALGEDENLIHYPWIEKPKPGKGAFFEMAKYIAKPVSFIGLNKSKGKKDQNSRPWTTDEMIEFYEVFQGARIFMTTGEFKGKRDEPEEAPAPKDEKLKEIITRCPINFEAAINGHSESLANIIFDAGIEGFLKVDVLKEMAFMVFDPEPDEPPAPVEIVKWSPAPSMIKKAMDSKAIQWERQRRFRREIKRSRNELLTACETAGAHW
jgi:hypothetical protein